MEKVDIDDYEIDDYEIMMIDDYESIYSVNPLHLRINHVSGYIEEKKWK